MPTNYIQKISKKYDIPVSELEKIWDKAKQLAAKEGRKENYAYITGIFKKIINGKFNIKEQCAKNYVEIGNGFLLKENDKWECYQFELNELDISKWIKIGGIAILLYNWIFKSSILLRKANLKYGDKVKKSEKDSFGKIIKKEGILIRRDGYPQVMIRSKTGIISYEKWDENWIKA